jgi:hypothetical protein
MSCFVLNLYRLCQPGKRHQNTEITAATMSKSTEITPVAEPRIIQVGPDRVTIKENEVIIDAKHRLEEWKVREINPWPVYFNDKKYNLIHARKGQKPYETTYLLVPWPADLSTTAKGFYTYDAEAVAERGATKRRGQFDDIGKAFLMPFYPFLGLFWSGIQTRLSRFGFVPRTITGVSIFVVFSMIFAQGVFAIVTINGSIRSGKIIIGGFLRAISSQDNLQIGPLGIPIAILDCVLVVVLLADVAMRYTYYLREHDWAGGLLEWVIRRPDAEREKETVKLQTQSSRETSKAKLQSPSVSVIKPLDTAGCHTDAPAPH